MSATLEVTKIAPPGATVVAVSLTAASSAATANGSASGGDSGSMWLTVCSDVACHLHFGESTMDAATTNHMRLPADTWVPFEVRKGTEGYVRAIKASGASDGTLWIYRSSR